MQYLKADTITEVTIGPAVAVGDGFTPVTGLVGSSADEFEIIKHGATATTTIAGTLAAITGADGYYALDLSATDTNTEGRLTLLINDDSLILPIRHEFMVVNANVFDSLFAVAGTDTLDVQVTGMGANVLTAAAINAAAMNGKGDWNIGKTGYSLTQAFPTNFPDLSIEVTTGLIDITQAAADKVWSSATRTLTAFSTALALSVWDVLESAILTASSIGLKVKNNLDAAITSRLAPTVAARTLDVAATGEAGVDLGNTIGSLVAADFAANSLDGKGDWNIGKTGYSLTQTFPTNFADLSITVTTGLVTLAGVTHTGAVIPTVSTLTGHTAQSGDSFTRLGAPAAASIAADLLAIDNFVDGLESTIGTLGAGLTDLGGMSTGMKAEILVEANAALDTAISELGVAAPTATPTIRTALILMYMALRNKLVVQTSGTDALEIYNNVGTIITQKLLTDDGSDYEEAQCS